MNNIDRSATLVPAVGAQVERGVRPVADVVAHPAYRAEFVPVIKVRPDHGLKHGDVLYADADVTRIMLADLDVQKDRTAQLLALTARVQELEAQEEGAKLAFGHIVEMKQAAEKECMRLQGLLAAAYADIRRAAQSTQGVGYGCNPRA